MNIEKFLKNKGIVRDKKQANIIMSIFIIICLFIIIMISKKNTFQDNIISNETLSPEEIGLMELADKDFTEADRLFDELSNKVKDQ